MDVPWCHDIQHSFSRLGNAETGVCGVITNLWIHKNIAVFNLVFLWIHKILAFISSKFYGSIKKWPIHSQNFVDP